MEEFRRWPEDAPEDGWFALQQPINLQSRCCFIVLKLKVDVFECALSEKKAKFYKHEIGLQYVKCCLERSCSLLQLRGRLEQV